MPPNKSIWYRIGFALERARQGPPVAKKSLKGLAERSAERKASRDRNGAAPGGWPTSDDLVAAGATAAVAKVLDGWQPRRKTGITRLVRAGAAGAAAALVVEVLRPLLHGEVAVGQLDKSAGERVITGVGQGLVYGAVVEPRVPGPALVKGALYGSAEYAVDPVGGLSHLLGRHTPQGRIPILADVLEGLDVHDRAYVEHVAFGVALAILYGSSASSNGIRIDVDEG